MLSSQEEFPSSALLVIGAVLETKYSDMQVNPWLNSFMYFAAIGA